VIFVLVIYDFYCIDNCEVEEVHDYLPRPWLFWRNKKFFGNTPLDVNTSHVRVVVFDYSRTPDFYVFPLLFRPSLDSFVCIQCDIVFNRNFVSYRRFYNNVNFGEPRRSSVLPFSKYFFDLCGIYRDHFVGKRLCGNLDQTTGLATFITWKVRSVPFFT